MDRSRTESQPIVREFTAQLGLRRGGPADRGRVRDLIAELRSRSGADRVRHIEATTPGVRFDRVDIRVDEWVVVRAEYQNAEALARFEAAPRIRVRGRDEEWELTMLANADTSPTEEGGWLRRPNDADGTNGVDRPEVVGSSDARGRGTGRQLERPTIGG